MEQSAFDIELKKLVHNVERTPNGNTCWAAETAPYMESLNANIEAVNAKALKRFLPVLEKIQLDENGIKKAR